MKKGLWIIGLLAVIAIAATSTYSVFAQSVDNGEALPANGFHGRGRGSSMGGQILQPYMEAALSEALGISLEDFQAAKAEGLRAFDIALEQGISENEFTALLAEARKSALAEAVADGVITQELADAMQAHFDQMGTRQFGSGTGICDGTGAGQMGQNSGGGRGGGHNWGNRQP